MQNEEIKLTYFPVRGRAEEARLCFLLADIKFVDDRISYEQFLEQKAQGKFKFDQIPVLQIGETQYAQSGAIMRYAALKSGFYPSDLNEVLLVEQALLIIQEFRDKVTSTLRMTEEEKVATRKNITNEYFPTWFPRVEKLLKDNGTGYFGKSLGLADFSLYSFSKWISSGMVDGIPATIFDQYPLISQVIKTVGSNPKIAQWDKDHNQ